MKIDKAIQSDSRRRVEAVLIAATCPLSAEEVSRLSGVNLPLVRTHINHAINNRRAHNLNRGKRNGSLYVWGPEEIHAAPMTLGRYVTPADAPPYKGEKPIVIRPGSARAFSLPSRMGEELREYRTCVRESA